MPFPAEAVPDGLITAPHHFTYLALAALIAVGTVWDDYRTKEPLVPVSALALGLFGFLLMWPLPRYRVLGAIFAVAGPIIATLAILNPWGRWLKSKSEGGYPWRTGIVAAALSIGALDDSVEHAFGIWTPLDWAFSEIGIYGSFAAAVMVILGVAIATTGWNRVRTFIGYPDT